MAFIRVPPSWQISEHSITPEAVFFSRRQFLKAAAGIGASATILPLMGCKANPTVEGAEVFGNVVDLPAQANPSFANVDRPVTNRVLAATYNNFYEFGGTKSIWRAAQDLPTEDWKVEVTGLVNNPKTYDLDDLIKQFPLEERVYRFRCVEAWSMVIPWLGFPMHRLIEAAEPTAAAKFVRFTSFYDPDITTGPTFHLGALPWPYTEGLRLEEMANELAFFAVGAYGQTLPKQHGAPIRMVIPWKYGFKGAKSVVKIEFIDAQPATYWNTINGYEYKFESNVDPNVPHPRWSQATERFIGDTTDFTWEERPTIIYNGYGDYVAQLYRA